MGITTEGNATNPLLEMVKRLPDEVARLRARLKTFPPRKTLALLSIETLMGGLGAKGPLAIHGEYLTWLFLIDEGDFERAGTLVQADYRELVESVARAVTQAQFRWVEQKQTHKLEDLAFKGRTEALLVRQPTYASHHRNLLQRLFAPFASELRSAIGIDVSSVLKLERTLLGLMEEKVNGIRVAMLEAAGGDEVSDESGAAVEDLDTFSSMLADAFTLSVDELADASGESVATVDAFLRLFKCESRPAPISDSTPSLYDPIERRPLVALADGRVFVALAYKLLWAIQPALESALRDANWAKYDHARSSFLEQEAVDLVARVSSRARKYVSLKYDFDDGNGLREFELDGLVLIDSVCFVIEAKAGAVALSARRGSSARLEDDLRKLVGDSHAQAARALLFITSAPSVTFRAPGGVRVEVRRRDLTRLTPVLVTLEPLTAYVVRLSALDQAGVLTKGRLPWAVYIHDLRVVTDLVRGAGELSDYIEKRLAIEKLDMQTHDELDWFGVYLSKGLSVEGWREQAKGFTHLYLGSFTDDIDAYYLAAETGVQREKPGQKIAEPLSTVVNELERSGIGGYVEAVCGLLLGGDDSREKLANWISDVRRRAQVKGFAAARMLIGGKLVSYAATVEPNRIELERYLDAIRCDAKIDEGVLICENVGHGFPARLVVMRIRALDGSLPPPLSRAEADRVLTPLLSRKVDGEEPGER